ncbi:hypothetical protein Ahy_A01g000375 [Arachis hypogaea]|uniref:PB1-like domain-containing protein n=1 Tax=Arachis hypogaea TaxID=3818 RepID=A0A445EK33_ARAHY|nr:hypothetical protein Ahy_A01g000375 [Arachis hypogaea]
MALPHGQKMVLFNMRVHHGGAFGYENSGFKYLRGQAIVIEDIDGNRWSVFEAYEELRQFGYLKSTIVTLWSKDPNKDDFESNLKLLKGDSNAIEMCNIAKLKGFVDLFVVHEVGDAEEFLEVGYINVGGDTRASKGKNLMVGDSAKDIHFADSKEEYDYDSGFGEENSVPKDSTADKGKRIVTSDLEDEEVADSDDMENDHMIGGQDLEADDAEEDDDCKGLRFPIHKPKKDMRNYKWKVGILYESRQEFKDTQQKQKPNLANNPQSSNNPKLPFNILQF